MEREKPSGFCPHCGYALNFETSGDTFFEQGSTETMQQVQEYESFFVKNFIQKKFQKRAFFELQSTKKRTLFFSRLCHGYSSYLNEQYMEHIDKHVNIQNKTRDILGKQELFCHIMAYDAAFDRKYVPLEEGVTLLDQTGMSIILMVEKNLAVFQAEAFPIKPALFLLFRGVN